MGGSSDRSCGRHAQRIRHLSQKRNCPVEQGHPRREQTCGLTVNASCPLFGNLCRQSTHCCRPSLPIAAVQHQCKVARCTAMRKMETRRHVTSHPHALRVISRQPPPLAPVRRVDFFRRLDENASRLYRERRDDSCYCCAINVKLPRPHRTKSASSGRLGRLVLFAVLYND